MKDEDFSDEEYGYSEEENSTSKSESDSNKKENTKILDEKTSYWQLDERIKGELDTLDFYVSNIEPAKFYVANTELNQIVRGYVGKEYDTDEEGKPTGDPHQKLRFSIPLIDAIPISGIKYNNGLNTDKKYKITFKTNTDETFTAQPNTVEDIVNELRGRCLTAKLMMAEDALRGIINSMERKGKIEITNEVEQPGFYLVDHKIECFGLEFKKPTDADIIECCKFMNELVERYEKKDETGKVINDRKVFPVTIFKWSINAPFNWIMKDYNKWVPWLHLGGWWSTAKNTLARLALASWRVHNKSGHIISFNGANSEARTRVESNYTSDQY